LGNTTATYLHLTPPGRMQHRRPIARKVPLGAYPVFGGRGSATQLSLVGPERCQIETPQSEANGERIRNPGRVVPNRSYYCNQEPPSGDHCQQPRKSSQLTGSGSLLAGYDHRASLAHFLSDRRKTGAVLLQRHLFSAADQHLAPGDRGRSLLRSPADAASLDKGHHHDKQPSDTYSGPDPSEGVVVSGYFDDSGHH